MALVSLCQAGNFVHVYDFRVKPGRGDEFIRLFDTFDYSDANPMHKSKAQAKDGVLCRDVNDPDHFYLLGEWRDIKVHAEILRAARGDEAGIRRLHRRRPAEIQADLCRGRLLDAAAPARQGVSRRVIRRWPSCARIFAPAC